MRKLREADRLLAGGKDVTEVAKHLEISEQTYHRWRDQSLHDWCRFSGTETSYIEPGAPWENPFVESFGSRLRHELLSVEQFDTLLEGQVMVGDWKRDYNHHLPYSSLSGRSPVANAATSNAENQVDRLSNEVEL